jgi:hypothetical protein
MFFIQLDAPFGSKTLFSDATGVCEFFSYPPSSEWEEVTFPTSEKAWSFVEKKFLSFSFVNVCESL